MNNLRIKFTLFTLIGLICFSSCKKESVAPDPTAEDINFTIEGDKNLEQTIYPSYLLGLSNRMASSDKDFFNFKLTNPIENAELKIKIEASNINFETVFQSKLANVKSTYSFSPLIKWNFANLKLLKQSGSVDMTFICYINNKETDRKNIRYAYRSVNECVYGYLDSEGTYVDTKWMFAAYVNEDNPKIDQLLKDVLTYKIVDSFVGYQSGNDGVYNQVYALWYYLQSKGVKYSSITATSNPSQKVFSQYVRFFADVYDNSQANCADGTVFLASILKKIGINPFLVVTPGHMYLGYYTTQDKSKIQLLETTMVGNVDLSEIHEDEKYVYNLNKYRAYITDNTYNGYFKNLYTLDYVKKEISEVSFLAATLINIDSWNSNLSKFNDNNNYQYKTFDIDELRQVVQPISGKKQEIIKIKGNLPNVQLFSK